MTDIMFFGVLLLIFQTLLTNSSKKYLGLILPGLTFLFSIGVLINLSTITDLPKIEIILLSLFSFILINIPTILFMLIFLFVKIRVKGELRAHLKSEY